MRVAVWDRYWSTMGGGEQVAGRIAQALSTRHDVDLLTPAPIDRARLEERLALDLSACGEVLVGSTEGSASAAARHHDLFVNCTYLSDAPAPGRFGLYYVHFPGGRPPAGEERRRRLAARANQALRRAHIAWGEGFHAAEPDGRTRWTNGLAVAHVWLPGGGELGLRVHADPWPSGARVRCTVKVGRDVVFDGGLPPGGTVLRVPLADRGPDRPHPVVVASDHFLPAEAFDVPDARQLGVMVTDVVLAGVGAGAAGRRPAWTFPPSQHAALDTYDVLLANSAYTARWTERLWGRAAEVLPPPVASRPGGAKGNVILSVGRFFDAASGHSKKQLEMARAFRSLVEDHGVEGWELHLVGGCAPAYRDYAMAVRRELLGLPAEVHFNAPGEDLADLLARASVYWHAAGMGEDLERHPDRAEHFGIAVVEAMSAGAVPVVFAAAGPAEIVRDGVDGRHVHDAAELAAATAALVRDPGRRAAMAAAAVERARAFERSVFDERLHAVVDGLAARAALAER